MKTIKKQLCSILSASILCGMVSAPALAEDGVTVYLNDKKIEFDVQPQIINERTMVPLRAIFEALGATVDWNGDTRTVTSTKDGTTISLTIDNPVMYVNGNEVALDSPACIIDERTLVPVRAISEAYGVIVDWHGESKTVIMTAIPPQASDAYEKLVRIIIDNSETGKYGYEFLHPEDKISVKLGDEYIYISYGDTWEGDVDTTIMLYADPSKTSGSIHYNGQFGDYNVYEGNFSNSNHYKPTGKTENANLSEDEIYKLMDNGINKLQKGFFDKLNTGLSFKDFGIEPYSSEVDSSVEESISSMDKTVALRDKLIKDGEFDSEKNEYVLEHFSYGGDFWDPSYAQFGMKPDPNAPKRLVKVRYVPNDPVRGPHIGLDYTSISKDNATSLFIERFISLNTCYFKYVTNDLKVYTGIMDNLPYHDMTFDAGVSLTNIQKNLIKGEILLALSYMEMGFNDMDLGVTLEDIGLSSDPKYDGQKF